VSLLAVDLGIRTGLAFYDASGRLVWYRSHNFGSHTRLRRGAPGILHRCEGLTDIALEGGGSIADIWSKQAQRQALAVTMLAAETWRADFLRPSLMRNAKQAKLAAGTLARAVIDHFGAKRPTSLRHDAAEAILVGLWAVHHLGWLPALPGALRR
jgi:hypothetical protein